MSAGPANSPANQVYFEGKRINFKPAAIRRARKIILGNTVVGPIVPIRRPNDHRPNLYVLSPAAEYGTSGAPQPSFTLIVNQIPRSDKPVDWDVYWALILDPAVSTRFTDERQLLVAAQDEFLPDQALAFDALPSASLLRQHLHIDSISGLESYRREDGKLPRLIIVSAGCAIRASAVDPESVASSRNASQ